MIQVLRHPRWTCSLHFPSSLASDLSLSFAFALSEFRMHNSLGSASSPSWSTCVRSIHLWPHKHQPRASYTEQSPPSSPQVPTSLITSSCYTYFNSTIYVYIFLLNYKRCSFFPGHLALLGMFNNILYWAPFSPSSSPRLLLFSMSLWGKPDFTGIQLGIYRINLGRREWLLHRWLVESWKMCTTQTCCFPNLDFQNLYVNWF